MSIEASDDNMPFLVKDLACWAILTGRALFRANIFHRRRNDCDELREFEFRIS